MLRLSKSGGVGGTIKAAPEDFVVEEITENGTTLETGRQYSGADLGESAAGEAAKFSRFVLQKKNWNTSQALREVAKRFRRGIRSVGFAGTKDRASVSTQLCSIFGVKPEELMRLSIKDISINGAWASGSAVRMGELMGNRFAVTVAGASDPDRVAEIDRELGGVFPNYFGQQRFGFRDNNVKIGLSIIRGDFEAAAMAFLTDTTNERNEDAVQARGRLAEERDFKDALGYFPMYLKYERLVLDGLAREGTDYAGALRRLPRSLALMFVHSVDSMLFNMEVEERVKEGMLAPMEGDLACPRNAQGFPETEKACKIGDMRQEDRASALPVGNIIGYNSDLNGIEERLLEGAGITKDQFRVAGMPELNCKGTRRALFAPYTGFSSSAEDGSVRMRFSLPSGSYATVLLEEFTGKVAPG